MKLTVLCEVKIKLPNSLLEVCLPLRNLKRHIMTVLIKSHNTEQHCFLEPNKHKISSLSFTEDRCVNICTLNEPPRSLQSPQVMGQIRDPICGIWRKRSPPLPQSLVICKWIRVFDIAHACARRLQPGHAVRSRNRRPLITPSCACALRSVARSSPARMRCLHGPVWRLYVFLRSFSSPPEATHYEYENTKWIFWINNPIRISAEQFPHWIQSLAASVCLCDE